MELLQEHPELTVAGEAGTTAQAIEVASHLHPDVTVIDLHLPEDGLALARDLMGRGLAGRVLLLASPDDRDELLAALLAGVAGSIAKDADPRDIQNAVLTIAQGGSVVEPMVATELLARLRRAQEAHPADAEFATLSPQEERILELLADGMTNGGIASELGLAEKTVKNYVSHIYMKLNVQRRSQAARLATERRFRRQGGMEAGT